MTVPKVQIEKGHFEFGLKWISFIDL